MPFQSEKQRRYLHANHPEIAKRWERDYATGGISNHFRKRFFRGAEADARSGKASMSPGTHHSGGTRHGNTGGGGGHHPPVYTGPTPAEIAAAKAKAEAEKRTLEAAARKKYLADFKDTQKKKGKHLTTLNPMKHPVESGAIAKGLETTQKGINLYNTIKSLKDLNPFGFLAGQALKKITSPSVKKTSALDVDTPIQVAKLSVKQIKEYKALDLKKKMNESGVGPPLTNEEKKELKQLEKEKESKLTTDSGTMIGAQGGVARKNYFHGGILDINESEEIIDDGGNDIELTAYNAAFDDPNDFSTGVKSLFRAKDGGKTIKGQEHMLAYITPGEAKTLENLGGQKTMTKEGIPAYPPWDDPGASPGTSHTANEGNQSSDQGHSRFEPGSGYYNEPVTTTTPVSTGGEWSGDYEDDPNMPGGSPWTAGDHHPTSFSPTTGEDAYGGGDYKQPGWEVNDDKEWVTVTGNHLEEMKRVQLSKLKNRGLKKVRNVGIMLASYVLMGYPLSDALKAAPKTLMQSINSEDLRGVIIESIPVAKARKEHIAALENYKKRLEGTGLPTHNPHIDTEWQKTTQALLNLTQKSEGPEDTGGDAPALPPQLGGPSTEEMAIEYDWMGAVRERQAQKKAYDEKIEREKLAREDNPIVSGTEMDIIALGNSGGLANLFRVKNQ